MLKILLNEIWLIFNLLSSRILSNILKSIKALVCKYCFKTITCKLYYLNYKSYYFYSNIFSISLKTTNLPLFQLYINRIVNHQDPTNFRFTYLLPSVSKVIERVIKTFKLHDNLDKNNVLIPEKFGLRAKLSTQFQLIRVVKFIK